jgi:hypothetical protein
MSEKAKLGGRSFILGGSECATYGTRDHDFGLDEDSRSLAQYHKGVSFIRRGLGKDRVTPV